MRIVAAFLLYGLLAAGAYAEMAPLADPTRPPNGFSDGALADGDDGGLRLQSILKPQGGKPTAIISGQVVRVGERIGEARLLRLTETEAVLRGPKGVERLFLTPDVQKSSAAPKATAMNRQKKEKP